MSRTAFANSSPFPLRRLSGAGSALAILTGINLFNYIDRYTLPTVLPAIGRQFALNYSQASLLTSAFFFSYVAISPIVGWMADRWPRKRIIAAGIVLWSAATLLSGIAPSYHWLLFARALVGIGEASYACIVPALIADFFPKEKRSQPLAIFNAAIMVGVAVGYGMSGWIGQHWGWREVFYVAGGPGLVLALLLLAIAEPPRGATEAASEPAGAAFEGRALLHNREFAGATLAMAMSTFALGALSVWMPTLLQHRGMSVQSSGLIFGLMTLINGIAATLLGGWWGDRALSRDAGGLFRVSAWSLLVGTPAAAIALLAKAPHLYLPAIGVAEFALFINNGPLNAALVNAVPAAQRARALGINLVLIHLLGDAFSPWLVGRIADRSGHLAWGMTALLPALGLGGLLCVLMARRLARTGQSPLTQAFPCGTSSNRTGPA